MPSLKEAKGAKRGVTCANFPPISSSELASHHLLPLSLSLITFTNRYSSHINVLPLSLSFSLCTCSRYTQSKFQSMSMARLLLQLLLLLLAKLQKALPKLCN